ncbi:hypothetical protein ALC53_02926 [Atta colombica]|uniref:Uncharacterized protein n=1 Tax=Atta colombica TaxID=520822 RepID=A0A195BQN1_9HYME|nr:hypothetical protein ALC53_02926 [Atta colombica]
MQVSTLLSMEPGGCAQTSEPQLELEESTVHSIERNATSWRARARVDSWRSRAALIFCSRRRRVRSHQSYFRVDGNCLSGNIRNMGRRKVSAGHGCSERDGCGLRATSEFSSTDVRQFDSN